MLHIVSTRIYLHEGDDCSFRLKYKNSEGDILDFPTEDTLTIYIKDRNNKVIFSEQAEFIDIGEEVSAVFTLNNSESIIPRGDYLYDILLETDAGSRHTLIDNAPINILESMSSKSSTDDKLNPGEFHPHSLESVGASIMYLSTTPLICRFDYIPITKKEVSGSLILFDKSVYNPDESTDENSDSLILFSEDPEDKSNNDDTLIIF